MSTLLVSDLHLTDNALDDYRWALFPWLAKIIPSHGIKHLFILGDITTAKDRHSAKLVNRVVNSVLSIENLTVWILAGNHYGTDATNPYFAFLGRYPNIKFISSPYMAPIDGATVLMLPHTKDPAAAWQYVDMHQADVVLMHATVTGAVAENGQVLDGVPVGLLRPAHRAKIYSGDIHVAQKVGPVEYVGAPYPIRFGDSYKGRAIMLNKWKNPVDLETPAIQRRTINITAKGDIDISGLHAGDQVKLRVSLSPAEYGDWQKLKKAALDFCSEHGLVVCGMELNRTEPQKRIALRRTLVKKPEDIFNRFCEAQKIDPTLRAAGQEILKGLS